MFGDAGCSCSVLQCCSLRWLRLMRLAAEELQLLSPHMWDVGQGDNNNNTNTTNNNVASISIQPPSTFIQFSGEKKYSFIFLQRSVQVQSICKFYSNVCELWHHGGLHKSSWNHQQLPFVGIGAAQLSSLPLYSHCGLRIKLRPDTDSGGPSMDNKWMATSKCCRFLPPRQRNVGDRFLTASLWYISWIIPQIPHPTNAFW